MDAKSPRTVARIRTRAVGDLSAPRAHLVPLYHGGFFNGRVSVELIRSSKEIEYIYRYRINVVWSRYGYRSFIMGLLRIDLLASCNFPLLFIHIRQFHFIQIYFFWGEGSIIFIFFHNVDHCFLLFLFILLYLFYHLFLLHSLSVNVKSRSDEWQHYR